ncbi:MAG: hypothetical protein LBC85_11430 [Fibromonadaceae bacterium]|jgi:hypothetical protein|nr:hypothetical protein [Fibromonadaceae bacterium]
MYTLKITGLTPQQDMGALVNTLLQVPGLNPQRISAGLKIPPFVVFSAKQEQEVKDLRTTLEKLGALCEIENTALSKKNPVVKKTVASAEVNKNTFSLKFWVIVIAVIGFLVLVERISSISASTTIQTPQQTKSIERKAEKSASRAAKQPTKRQSAKKNRELKSDLSRNPYNTGAWKALYENLEREGDTVSARRARESYERALRAQMVMASLARAFGNDARAEVTDNAVYYRTTKDLTDSEFYHEAEKLRESVNARFPGKDLILENYTSDGRVQTIRLKPGYRTTD